MKHFITISGILAALLISSLAVNAQEKMKAQEKKMDSKKHEQMMEMMKDSTMMNMMMEHMATDDHMRMKMMHKMMEACKSDESKMMGMCKKMREDEEMHSMMMKMMGETQAAEAAAQEVLVKFKPDAKEEQITSMASEVGMKQVKFIKQLNLRVFEITSGKSVEEVIKHCQKEPYVEYAEPNLKYKTMK